MKTLVRTTLLASACAIALGGCASTASRRVHADYRSTSDAAQARAEAGRTVTTTSNSFQVDGGFYVEKTPIAVAAVDKSHDLPDYFRTKKQDLDIKTPTPLTEVTARISRSASIPVTVAQDVLDNNANLVGQVLKSGAAGASGGGGSAGSAGNAQPILVDEVIYHNGTLAGLLDDVTGKLGLSWRWNGNGVEIYRYETKQFHLDSLAGIATLKAKIDTASSTLSTGGSGTQSSSATNATTGQSTEVNSTSDIWGEVTTSVQGMLSPNGRMSVAPISATITVRDTPTVLRQVEAQVSQLNRIYNKQVALNVEVYSVERSDTDNYGVDFNLAFANAAHHIGLGYSTIGNNGTPSQPLGNAAVISATGGPFAGSSLTLSALTALGKTSLVTSGQAISLNGQSVPLNVSREQAYLQSQTTTLSGGTGSGLASTQLTPGLVTEGFSMNFTPLVTDGGDVLMRYTVDLSTIEGITTYTTPDGSASIQLPQRSVRNFMQNVRVHSGETLVLTGFQQNSGNEKEQGTGSSRNWVLGGGRQATALNRTIVVVVTPYILGR